MKVQRLTKTGQYLVGDLDCFACNTRSASIAYDVTLRTTALTCYNCGAVAAFPVPNQVLQEPIGEQASNIAMNELMTTALLKPIHN